MSALTPFEDYYTQPHSIDELSSYSFAKDRPSEFFTPLAGRVSRRFKIQRELDILKKCADINLHNLSLNQRNCLIANAKLLCEDLSRISMEYNKINPSIGFVESTEVKEANLLLNQIRMDPRAQDMQEIEKGIFWLQKHSNLLERTEGVVRIAGSAENVKKLKKDIKSQIEIADDANIHDVINMVKKSADNFYSSLMNFTKGELEEFNHLKDEEQQIFWIKNKIEEKLEHATKDEKDLFANYIKILNFISRHSKKNKMDASNLSLIISAIFTAKLSQDIMESKVIPPNDKYGVAHAMSMIAIKMTEKMIQHPSEVFPS